MAEEEDIEPLLESPASAGDLYYAGLGEVPEERPVLTGDIFSGIKIPGLDEDAGNAIVLTHPCGMRKDGVRLVNRIFMARVRTYQAVQLENWSTQHFKVMPLPSLSEDRAEAAAFNDAGLVPSDQLDIMRRVACLSEFGINLLQQRFVYHLTRFVVPTHKLHRVAPHVFREAELQEEWVGSREPGTAIADAGLVFHDWLRERPPGGLTRQERLTDPQQAAAVRREMREALRR